MMYLSPYKANLINTFQTIKWVDCREQSLTHCICVGGNEMLFDIKHRLFSYLKLKNVLHFHRRKYIHLELHAFYWTRQKYQRMKAQCI